MLLKLLSGKKNGLIAGLLMLATCLPLSPGALAASPPSAPESLTAVPGNGKVGLIWFAPDDDGGASITGYQVSMDGGAVWIDVGLATSYTFDGLTGGIMYVFMTRAVNDSGYGEEAIANAKPKDGGAEATPAPTDGLGSLFDVWFAVTPEPDDGNSNGNQQGHGQVITGGGGGGIIVEPPPPPPPPEDDPPEDPPPKKETPEEPQPEDSVPIRIDPEEVTEKPFRPKRARIKQLAGTYTIIASGVQRRLVGDLFMLDIALDFKATKAGGNIDGGYSGNGTLTVVADKDFYEAAVDHLYTVEYAGGGPLTDISFALLTPLKPVQPSSNSGSGLQPLPPLQPAGNSGSSLKPLPPIQQAGNSGTGLTPLPPIQQAENSGTGLTPLPPIQQAENSGSSLKPLPPIQPMPPAQATGTGSMYWNASTIHAHAISLYNGAKAPVLFPFEPETIPLEIRLYENGTGIVKIKLWTLGVSLIYEARLVKNVTLTNVK